MAMLEQIGAIPSRSAVQVHLFDQAAVHQSL